MKTIFYLSAILLITLCSCDNYSPVSTFEEEFPNNNKNLSNILGSDLIIKTGSDTVHLKIISDKKGNWIINTKSNDTIFNGKVSKFMGRYYFSQKQNDNSYLIHSVDVNDSLIKGLINPSEQYFYIDELIKSGKYSKLVKNINSDTSQVKLYSSKRESKKMFNEIMNHITPDTILKYKNQFNIYNDIIEKNIDKAEYSYIKNVYPNPVVDVLTIELPEKQNLQFQLVDINGKVLYSGQLNDIINKIDISKCGKGLYHLIVFNEHEREVVKINKL